MHLFADFWKEKSDEMRFGIGMTKCLEKLRYLMVKFGMT